MTVDTDRSSSEGDYDICFCLSERREEIESDIMWMEEIDSEISWEDLPFNHQAS